MPPHQVNDAMLRRVYSEFMEMPGLRLTLRQAQRLWGLDEPTCTQLLDALVDANFLCRRAEGTYGRSSDGPLTGWRPRMARADLRHRPPTSIKKAV